MSVDIETGNDREADNFSSDHSGVSEGVSILVFQSGALIWSTRKLSTLAAQATDKREADCLVVATILTAAALDAILSEFLHQTNLAAFTKDFRKAGVPQKYEMIRGSKLADDYPDVLELWARRIAICHSEPGNARSRTYGTRINSEGSHWAYKTVESFARNIWGESMPGWFRSDME